MTRRVMQKIKPFHPPEAFKPPPGAVAAGVTPDGKQLYRWTVKKDRSVPRLVETPEAKEREAVLRAEGKSSAEIGRIMTDEGFRQYRKNQMTGELAYPLNRAERYEEEQLFYIESQGNGNNSLVRYTPPTPAEIAAQYRRQQVERMGGGKLGELLVDEGLSPEDLVSAIRYSKTASE